MLRKANKFSRNSQPDLEEDEDAGERQKMKFNILDNLKNRENMKSLLENSFLEKRVINYHPILFI